MGVAYEPELSLWRLISGVLREKIAPIGLSGTEQLKRLRQLAEMEPKNGRFYLSRIKQLETWRRRMNTVLPLLAALLGPKKKTGDYRECTILLTVASTRRGGAKLFCPTFYTKKGELQILVVSRFDRH